MKNLIIIFTMLFSTVFFSSPSYAEWKKVVEGASGDTYYVDFERIRKHDGYIYFWRLNDCLTPTSSGRLSAKVYRQGDCKLFRYKSLSYSFHDEPIGMGSGVSDSPKNPEWTYPSPNSSGGATLKSVCNR